MILAGLLAARQERGGLSGERVLFMGAGAAAIGIARMIQLQLEDEGVPPEQARRSIAMLDRTGLVHTGRDTIADDQLPHASDPAWFGNAGLSEADLADPVAIARALRPTVLIGTTGGGGVFSEALVREVARHADVPIVLPLSNPGDRAEASVADVLRWTDGRALVATGGPNPDAEGPMGRRAIGQANNVFIFPGVGLGTIMAEVHEVTDTAFLVAAHELAGLVSAERLAAGAVYPPISQLRVAARAIAVAVMRHARDSGYGRQYREEDIGPTIDRAMWDPVYLPFEPA